MTYGNQDLCYYTKTKDNYNTSVLNFPFELYCKFPWTVGTFFSLKLICAKIILIDKPIKYR